MKETINEVCPHCSFITAYLDDQVIYTFAHDCGRFKTEERVIKNLDAVYFRSAVRVLIDGAPLITDPVEACWCSWPLCDWSGIASQLAVMSYEELAYAVRLRPDTRPLGLCPSCRGWVYADLPADRWLVVIQLPDGNLHARSCRSESDLQWYTNFCVEEGRTVLLKIEYSGPENEATRELLTVFSQLMQRAVTGRWDTPPPKPIPNLVYEGDQ